MSQILQYFRSLFEKNPNNNRKRRRTEAVVEEHPFPIKYRRVTNIFPKTYTRPIEDENDFFEQVQRKKVAYNEYIGTFLMDKQQKQFKSLLEDGEFSDEDELNSNRYPSQYQQHQRKLAKPAYNFGAYRDPQQNASTSSAFRTSSSSAFGDENDSFSILKPPRSRLNDLPQLIPIRHKVLQNNQQASNHSRSSSMTNGHHESEKSFNIAAPVRGRRSVFDISKQKYCAFPATPPPLVPKSVITQQNNMAIKEKYDELLMKVNRNIRKTLHNKPNEMSSPITTIDLSEDNNEYSTPSRPSLSKFILSDEIRKHDLRKSSGIATTVDIISDDDDNEEPYMSFSYDKILSSTLMGKSPTGGGAMFSRVSKSHNATAATTSSSVLPPVKPINSLKEKQAYNKACEPDSIEKICKRFQELREQKEKSIAEEEIKSQTYEQERLEFERQNQKRIDDSLLNVALLDKCIIIDEEDAVDEFPPLTDQQNKLVNFALHGPRQETIISKFKMDVTRYDLATLDGLNWLNDMVINFYLELIKERSEQVEFLPKVHVMNTVFLGKLLEQGYASVRRWTRRVDIFAYDIIPVPVHVGGVHWCMSIIHLKNKTIRYYDSMGHPNYVVLEALKNYLKEESLDKKKVPFDTSDWTLECIRDCPQQRNGSDCGVFSCQFAEFISRDSDISFEQQHMPYIRRKMIYEIASGKLLLGF